ncbi:replication initiator, partial [Nonomuraea diastatica]|uniref:replication initiator n=1 Tax=Nonomuraea diastatica TaxID=1848329 RepID=UPI003CCC4E1F
MWGPWGCCRLSRLGGGPGERCPPAARYRADAWHVFAAGVTASVGGDEHGGHDGRLANPLVLATFTAPSFGRVHAARDDGGVRDRPGRWTGRWTGRR